MVVAVAANAHGRNFSPEDRLETLEDVLFPLKDSLSVNAHGLRQFFEAPPQEWKGPRSVAAHRLIDRALIEGRKRFGGEMGIGRVRSQREVQLGCALSQQLRRRQV